MVLPGVNPQEGADPSLQSMPNMTSVFTISKEL